MTFDPTSGSPSVSVDAARSSRPETLEAVLDVIYASELKGYELSLASVTGTQLHVLATLARLGPQKPTGSDFIRAAGATQASSVQRALASLVKKRILFTHGGCYRFINPFFAAWLLHKGL